VGTTQSGDRCGVHRERVLEGNKVQAHVGPWTITLDLGYSQDDAESRTTRLSAPYINPDGFRFTICRRSRLSDLDKLLDVQDIEVGAPDLDEGFIIQCNRTMERPR
jgi:hypothetical protein